MVPHPHPVVVPEPADQRERLHHHIATHQPIISAQN